MQAAPFPKLFNIHKPPWFKQCSFNRMKENPRYLFWNTPSTCSLSSFNTKSLCDQELQCKQDETIRMMKFNIFRDIRPWYFEWFPNGEKTSTSPFEICFIPVNFSKKKTTKYQLIYLSCYIQIYRGDTKTVVRYHFI